MQQERRRGRVVRVFQPFAREDGAGESDDAGIAESFREILPRQVAAVAAFEVALERGDGTRAAAYQQDFLRIDGQFRSVVDGVARDLHYIFGSQTDGVLKRLDHAAHTFELHAFQAEAVVGGDDDEAVAGQFPAKVAGIEYSLIVFDKTAAVAEDDAGMLLGVIVREIKIHFQRQGVILGEGDGLVGLERGAVQGSFLRIKSQADAESGEERQKAFHDVDFRFQI